MSLSAHSLVLLLHPWLPPTLFFSCLTVSTTSMTFYSSQWLQPTARAQSCLPLPLALLTSVASPCLSIALVRAQDFAGERRAEDRGQQGGESIAEACCLYRTAGSTALRIQPHLPPLFSYPPAAWELSNLPRLSLEVWHIKNK